MSFPTLNLWLYYWLKKKMKLLQGFNWHIQLAPSLQWTTSCVHISHCLSAKGMSSNYPLENALLVMFRGQKVQKQSRAAHCDNPQRDARAACWDRGLQKNVPCLQLSAMFNWNRTCPWKGIHRFGEIKCSIWTNGEMTTLCIVKVQTSKLLSHADAPPPTPVHFSLNLFSAFVLEFSKLSLHPISVQVHIQGSRWVSGLKETLDISSCRHTCPPSWSPSSPGSPFGSIMMPLQLAWPWVRHKHCCIIKPPTVTWRLQSLWQK